MNQTSAKWEQYNQQQAMLPLISIYIIDERTVKKQIFKNKDHDIK